MLKALPPEILVTNPKSQLIEILTPPLVFRQNRDKGGSKFRNPSDIKRTKLFCSFPKHR